MKLNSHMVDTETAGSLDNAIVYNINVRNLATGEDYNYLVNEIFFDPDLMDTAYYKAKKPQYIEDLIDGEIEAEDFWEIRKRILEQLPKGARNVIYAHNAGFDIRALNNTCRYLSDGRVKYFFPFGTEIRDTLKMARQVLGKMPTYLRFCEENGYMTKHKTPRPRFTAEVIYRFIIKDTGFEEAHRAKEDVDIEEQILNYIKRQHKKCNPVLFPRKKG